MSEVHSVPNRSESAPSSLALREEASGEPMPPLRTVAYILLAFAAVLVLVVAINELCARSVLDEVHRKRALPDGAQLEDLRRDQEAWALRESGVGPDGGIVGLPIHRAKELVRTDYAGRRNAPSAVQTAASAAASPPAAMPIGIPNSTDRMERPQ